MAITPSDQLEGAPGNAPAWLQKLRGRFLVFDGPDGSGKSTQLKRMRSLLQQAGVPLCEVREPGGTEVGESIRRALLDPSMKEEMDLRCEMLLFMASRSQLVTQRVQPAIERGECIIADRFISSTLAYQGTAGGLPIDEIMAVGRVALQSTWPDLVLVFDVDEATAANRMNPLIRTSEFDRDKDRMELKGAAFHRKVRQGYWNQAEQDPEHTLLIDASSDEDTVFGRLMDGLSERVRGWASADDETTL